MEKSEEWAIAYSRLEAFFHSQDDVSAAESEFRFQSCRIILQPLDDRTLGGLSFPRCRITFSGPDEEVNIIYHRFFMRFISAGG